MPTRKVVPRLLASAAMLVIGVWAALWESRVRLPPKATDGPCGAEPGALASGGSLPPRNPGPWRSARRVALADGAAREVSGLVVNVAAEPQVGCGVIGLDEWGIQVARTVSDDRGEYRLVEDRGSAGIAVVRCLDTKRQLYGVRRVPEPRSRSVCDLELVLADLATCSVTVRSHDQTTRVARLQWSVDRGADVGEELLCLTGEPIVVSLPGEGAVLLLATTLEGDVLGEAWLEPTRPRPVELEVTLRARQNALHLPWPGGWPGMASADRAGCAAWLNTVQRLVRVPARWDKSGVTVSLPRIEPDGKAELVVRCGERRAMTVLWADGKGRLRLEAGDALRVERRAAVAVRDQAGSPLSGLLVSDEHGFMALTDDYGRAAGWTSALGRVPLRCWGRRLVPERRSAPSGEELYTAPETSTVLIRLDHPVVDPRGEVLARVEHEQHVALAWLDAGTNWEGLVRLPVPTGTAVSVVVASGFRTLGGEVRVTTGPGQSVAFRPGASLQVHPTLDGLKRVSGTLRLKAEAGTSVEPGSTEIVVVPWAPAAAWYGLRAGRYQLSLRMPSGQERVGYIDLPRDDAAMVVTLDLGAP